MAKSPPVKCTLFVQGVDKNDLSPSAAKARGYTIDILQFVEKYVVPRKAAMNIDVQVKLITKKQLQDAKVVAALKKQQVAKLPALITPAKAYLGVGDIKKLFTNNIQRYEATTKAKNRDEDGLEKYYRSEMSTRRMEHEDDEHAIGETSGDMMSAAQDMMKRREQRMAKTRPSAIPDVDEKSYRPPGPTASRRPGHNRPSHDDDDESVGEDRTISSILGSLSSMDRGRGDDDESEGSGPNPADGQMAKAYWENQELTQM